MARHKRTELTEQQLKAAELIAAGFMAQNAIAEEIGCTPQAIMKWRRDDPLFREEIDRCVLKNRSEIRNKMFDYGIAALGYLYDVLNNPKIKNQNLKMRAACELRKCLDGVIGATISAELSISDPASLSFSDLKAVIDAAKLQRGEKSLTFPITATPTPQLSADPPASETAKKPQDN